MTIWCRADRYKNAFKFDEEEGGWRYDLEGNKVCRIKEEHRIKESIVKYVTVKEAAKKLNCSEATIRRMIKNEKLNGVVKEGVKYLIPDNVVVNK